MGLFSVIGSVVGNIIAPGIGGKIGAGLGAFADGKLSGGSSGGGGNVTDPEYYVKLREAAEKGGFNPLEALRSGGGGGFSSPNIPGIASNAALTGVLDQWADIASGDAERRRARELKEHELFMIESERTIAGGSVGVVDRTRAATNVSTYGVNDKAIGRDGAGLGTGGNAGPFALAAGGLGLTVGPTALAGVDPADAVRGTVPYVGMTGNAVTGPNAENQMGIDEVLGWLAMEGFAVADHGIREALKFVRNSAGTEFRRIEKGLEWLEKNGRQYLAPNPGTPLPAYGAALN